MYRQRSWLSPLARDELHGWFLVFDLGDIWQWSLARKDVIMSAGDLIVLICSRCFDLAPKRFSGLGLGSVNAFRLTMRAPDKWESARFQAVCVA